MLDTWTRFSFSMPASLSASSNDRSSSRWLPTPFVKKIFVGTSERPASGARRSTSGNPPCAPLSRVGTAGALGSVVRFIVMRSPWCSCGCLVLAGGSTPGRGIRRRPFRAGARESNGDEAAARLDREPQRASSDFHLALDFLAFSRDVNRKRGHRVERGHDGARPAHLDRLRVGGGRPVQGEPRRG